MKSKLERVFLQQLEKQGEEEVEEAKRVKSISNSTSVVLCSNVVPALECAWPGATGGCHTDLSGRGVAGALRECGAHGMPDMCCNQGNSFGRGASFTPLERVSRISGKVRTSQLQDNVTLAEAGVREGSTLFVLSRKLAEAHWQSRN